MSDPVLVGVVRAAIADADARLAVAERQIFEARSALLALQRAGAPVAEQRVAERQIATLQRDRDAILVTRRARLAELDGLRKAFVDGTTPEATIGRLDGRVPITLLPVRLETRFADSARVLRIRVYPEPIHLDGHEPELTDEELAAAEQYWRQRWAAGSDPSAQRAAWHALTASFRPTRARWLADATTPTNLADLGTGEPELPAVAKRAGPWTRAPLARLLPDRWVAVGYRGGAEVFRKWGAPIGEDIPMGLAPDLDDDGVTAPPPAEQTELPIDESLRWTVDFAEAERLGMAITVANADLRTGTLAAGVDLLVVAGVDWTLTADTAAVALADQLRVHFYSDGLSFLRPGTPTNNTDATGAGGSTNVALDVDLLDPATAPGTTKVAAASSRLEAALGFSTASALRLAPGGDRVDDVAARHMANALWAPTWGYFLEQMMQPLVSDRGAELLRDHFRRYVRGRGPLPTLRVGRQPYGVLPVVDPGAFRPTAPRDVEAAIAERVAGLRPLWSRAAENQVALGHGARPDEDLLALLRSTPRSASFRLREVVGPATRSNSLGLGVFASFQDWFARLMLALVGIDGRPHVVDTTIDPGHRLLPVPLVRHGERSETEPLDPNYIRTVLTDLTKAGGFAQLVKRPDQAGSLLEALLLHAAQLEMAAAAVRLVATFEVQSGVLTEALARVGPDEREVHGLALAGGDVGDVDDGGAHDAPASLVLQAESALSLAQTRVTGVSGNRTLVNHLAILTTPELRQNVDTRRLAEFRDSVDQLADVPVGELHRLVAETLDCSSHRLDAWQTSLATRRLDDPRRRDAPGTHVGGFGWVEDLRPRAAGTASLGYVHAPSIPQANAAAVLRSAHLSRRGDADGALALDLSSQRVALALELLDGVRQGQPIGALLGYRFERGLRERRLTLAQYILPLRRIAPLATATDGFDDGRPLEAVAARDVVDGATLLDLWNADRDRFFTTRAELPDSGPDRDDLTAELVRLDDTLDAVSDVLVAESVYQAVAGNTERSAAALDALDRQTGLPDVGVVRTPRRGIGGGQRLMILLTETEVPPAWAGTEDPRGQAEPRLNAWAAAVLGDPGRYRFAAEAVDAQGATVQRLQLRLPELGLSPLSTLLAASSGGGADKATELEERLALALAALTTSADATELRLLEDPPPGAPVTALGLRDLLDLSRRATELVSSTRPATAPDLAPDTVRPLAGVDAAELAGRADAAVEALRDAVDGLPADATNATVEQLSSALLAAADAGRPAAVPIAGDAATLAAQVARVRTDALARLGELDAAEAAFDRSAADAAVQMAHDLARLRGVFGEVFPATPLFTPVGAAELVASLSDPALVGVDPLAPTVWLQQHALVRPAATRLSAVLTAGETLGTDVDPTQLSVMQLPHTPGQRWSALPLDPAGPRRTGSLAIVAHHRGRLDLSGVLCGRVVDSWDDVVPDTMETTGISFHYDAPGARAPQTILVAAPPDPSATTWMFEHLIGSIREAYDLAKLRSVDLDMLEAVARFLPATYLAFNLERKSPSINFATMVDLEIERANAEFHLQEGDA